MLASLSAVYAGIAFDNEIRGWLVVLVGTAVLMGSVWLILATNLGHRLATLVAFAGFFGWMAIMGFIWWIYGIGYAGAAPTWVPVEFFSSTEDLATSERGDVDRLANASTEASAADLLRQYCPGLVEGLEATFAERVAANDDTIAFVVPSGIPSYCTEEVGELLAVNSARIEATDRATNDALADDDPRKLTEEALAEEIATDIDNEGRRRAGLTLSGLDSVAPLLIDDAEAAGDLEFQGWRLIPTSESGEAQATADAFLTNQDDTLDTGFATSADFVVLNTFERGGKELRTPDEDGVWDRVWHELKESATILNPPRYAVVEVQRTLQKPTIEGEAPPFPEGDDTYPVNYVLMVRDLGDRRLPPFIVMVGATLAFAALCLMLNRREAHLRETAGKA